MRRFFGIFFLIAIGFIIGFGFREVRGEIQARREARKKQYSFSTHPVLKEKPFVVLMFEGDSLIEESLLSVLSQEYGSYRALYLSKGGHQGKMFLQSHDPEGKVIYIERKKGQTESELLYRALHTCTSDEIVVLLRKGEVFAHHEVLTNFNKHFADPNVWALTSEKILYPTYEKRWSDGTCQAFYAGLGKQIKLEDFLIDGKFAEGKYEDILFPSIKELSGAHFFGIHEALFLTVKKEEEVVQREGALYSPLKEYPWHDFAKDEERVDLMVFSYNRPLQLYAFLESAEKHLENVHRQYVIYRAGNDHYEKGYGKVKETFPNVVYIRQSVENPSEDFALTLKKTLFDRNISSARYITFAYDDFLIKETIDLKESVQLLKETGAYGFYFCLGNNLKNHPKDYKLLIQEGVYGWQFSKVEGEWRVPNSLRMTLLKKNDLEFDFMNMQFHSPNILESLWNEGANLSKIGLYYDRSKAVSLPLNIAIEGEGEAEKFSKISTKELLTYFDQGLKMNTAQIEEIENESIDVSIKSEFIQR